MNFNILAPLLLQLALTRSHPPASAAVTRGCPTCAGNQVIPSRNQPSTEGSVATLAFGEPCGVYTLSCAPGLRCSPPEDDLRPLRALLEGRGTCNSSRTNPTGKIFTVESAPTKMPEEAPCRKLLTNLIRGLDTQLFQSHDAIYMPNCDKRGYFRKKQCWSSRGKQRGKCWCVDENGLLLPSKHRGPLTCQGS